jgi:hypothetical protein
VAFVENALVKKSWQHLLTNSALPSLLLDELLMDLSNSDGFFLRRLVHTPGRGSAMHLGLIMHDSTSLLWFLE